MASPPPDYVPPPWLRFVRKNIWVIAFVLGAITITLLRPLTRHVPDPPPVMFHLPDYRLVDHEGRAFTPDTMKGKVWVAGFIFTRCPSTCPAVTRAMADLRARFDRNSIDVPMVSFTVDPEYDTVKVLAEHAANVGADGETWRFVTGEPAAVRSLVVEGFKLGMGAPEVTPSGAFDIAHSTKLALVDRDGNVRGYYGIEPDQGLDEIFHRAEQIDRTEKPEK